MERKILSPQLVLPESDRDPAQNNNIGFGFPTFLFGGSMELMAVPKRKVYVFIYLGIEILGVLGFWVLEIIYCMKLFF